MKKQELINLCKSNKPIYEIINRKPALKSKKIETKIDQNYLKEAINPDKKPQ